MDKNWLGIISGGIVLVTSFAEFVADPLKPFMFWVGVVFIIIGALGAIGVFRRLGEWLGRRRKEREAAEPKPAAQPRSNAVWDAAQCVAWIVARDDMAPEAVKTANIQGDEYRFLVEETYHALEMAGKLGLADETPLDDAAQEISDAARKGEVIGRGRRDAHAPTEDVAAAEWVGHTLNPYTGRIRREGDDSHILPAWIDVTFREREVRERWPAKVLPD